MRRSGYILSLLLASAPLASVAFVGSPITSTVADNLIGRPPHSSSISSPIISSSAVKYQHATSLQASIGGGALSLTRSAAFVSSFVSTLIASVRRHANILLLLLAATVLFAKRSNPQAILWPGTEIDDKEMPLPPGSYGCPFIGMNLYGGTKSYGPFAGLAKMGKKFGNIYKLYSFGLPLISVTGVDNIKSLLKSEFKPDGLNTYMMGKENVGPIFGEKGILYEGDAETHSLLRRLVGSAMTPSAISEALPQIQELANDQVEKMLNGDVMKMEKVFSDYTLDIAWKQILGLDLKVDEISKFHSEVEDWIGGMMSNPLLALPFHIPGIMIFSKAGRARTYLVSKVEEKLAQLDKDGPDSSTLSKLYFATDENDGKTKLTRTQVIHNALLLILAGSETSASTLTCASLIIALHPDVWKNIKDEQRMIRSEHGDEFTQQCLEKCKYLDYVIKETLRLKPVETAELRKIEQTVIVDGKQIPKGWFAVLNIKQTHLNDPVVYEDDESHMDIKKGFKPERWEDESTKPAAWMPFGDGRRRCIGERLAMAEMKVFLAMLARKVDYELVNDSNEIAWKTNTIMARPLDGVEVKARASA